MTSFAEKVSSYSRTLLENALVGVATVMMGATRSGGDDGGGDSGDAVVRAMAAVVLAALGPVALRQGLRRRCGLRAPRALWRSTADAKS